MVQHVRSPRTLGLMAAIQGNTAPVASVANDEFASPERLRSLGRHSPHLQMSSKVAGDMYADSVLTSSPMVAFSNFVYAGRGVGCNRQDEDMMPGRQSKPSGSSSPPCCTHVAPLSQLRHQFNRYSENCSIRGNLPAVSAGVASMKARTHSKEPARMSPCHRLSRSLSTSRSGKNVTAQSHLSHSPSIGRQCKLSSESASHLSHSLSPSSMHPAGHARPRDPNLKAGTYRAPLNALFLNVSI
jgi:hypothetical protein